MKELELLINDLQRFEGIEFVNRTEVLNRLTEINQALQLHKTQVSGSCNIYKLQCINEDGHYEENGYFFKEELAEDIKKRLDNLPYNKKYGIVQDIVTVEVL